MARIYTDFTQLIGHTPLMELCNYERKHETHAKILAKLEYFNPAGSAKDRVGCAMIEDAESKGLLVKDSVIIEPTSGNTGIGLAAVAASRGYQVILTMPDTMSVERCNLLKAYGAKLVLTPGSLGMKGAIDRARELAEEIPHAYMPGQFDNNANPDIHKTTTGPEIWEDADGKVDIFVSAIGTGGTMTGVGEFLKERNPQVKLVAVEPFSSAVLSHKKPGAHKIQGIGAGFIPKTLRVDFLDEIIPVHDDEAYKAARELCRMEGLLVGISSGAAAFAATVLAKREENRDKNIVVILPDTGERYLSTPFFID